MSRRNEIATALRVEATCRLIDRAAAELGIRVLYLKGAWAGPVLYSAPVRRPLSDVDILVATTDLERLCGAISALGYRRISDAWPAQELGPRKAATLVPLAGGLPIDVHRALASAPWFRLPAEPFLTRARAYPANGRVIWSLSPEDQVLHAAVHAASQALRLDERHFADVRLLLGVYTVDWDVILRRAEEGGLRIPLAWLGRWLAAHGMHVPREILDLRPLQRSRLRAARWLGAQRGPGRRAWVAMRLLGVSLLSDEPRALPRFLRAWLAARRGR